MRDYRGCFDRGGGVMECKPEYDHELKVAPPYIHAISSGEKKFEVRRDDRGFQRGDVLWLREYNAKKIGSSRYTGNEEYVRVDWILTGGQFGIEPGYVVMSISVLREGE